MHDLCHQPDAEPWGPGQNLAVGEVARIKDKPRRPRWPLASHPSSGGNVGMAHLRSCFYFLQRTGCPLALWPLLLSLTRGAVDHPLHAKHISFSFLQWELPSQREKTRLRPVPGQERSQNLPKPELLPKAPRIPALCSLGIRVPRS